MGAHLNSEQYARVYQEYLSGKTICELSREHHLSEPRVRYIITAKGLKAHPTDVVKPHRVENPPRKIDHRTIVDRVKIQEMIALYKTGATMQALGTKYGVSRERVRQLLSKHQVDTKQGGAAVITQRRLAELEQKQLALFEKKAAEHDLTVEEYVLHVEQYGTRSAEGSPLRAYHAHERNVLMTGAQWGFTFKTWWAAWEKSGKWGKRGRGGFSMRVRYPDKPIGPENYEIWKIKGGNRKTYKTRNYENMSKRWGLTAEEYSGFLDQFGGSDVTTSPFHRYGTHRARVLREFGLRMWNISFKDWWKTWKDSGKWVGVEITHGYGMMRIDRAKPFEVGNVVVKNFYGR